jgi:tetratricopeptide (TPR) repeat protein
MSITKKLTFAASIAFTLSFPAAAVAQSKPTSKPAALVAKKEVSKKDKTLAIKKLREAYGIADKDASKAEVLALAALKLYPDYEQVRSFLGWLYNVKLGENKKAMAHYDHLIRNSKNKKIKADALANKGSLLFIETRNGETGIELYKAAYGVYRLWEYADKASNLCMHINKVKRAHHNAKLAHNSIMRLVKRLEKVIAATDDAAKEEYEKKLELLEPNVTKVKLQLASCLILMNKKDEAAKIITGDEEFPRSVKYNLAIYRGVRGEKEGVINCLTDFMATRKTAKARNLLRDFIKEEPIFKQYLERKRFAKLVEKEKEK